MYILNSKQVSEADKATIQKNNISSIDLMEHAATQCFNWIHTRLQGEQIPIHVFCGIGNNGGDGLVIARLLHLYGYNVICYVVNFSEKRTPEFLDNYNKLKELGKWPKVITAEEEFPTVLKDDLVIDAIFGNGLTRKPEGFTKKLINYLNKSNAYILSIDFPSGLFSDKSINDKNAVIKANHILTFHCPKLSFFLPENKEFVEAWDIIDIGLDEEYIESLQPKTQFVLKETVLSIYQHRNRWSHKGSYGHSLVIGGSFGKMGAIVLSAKAALNIGSGLISAYVPKCGYSIVQSTIPEVMVEVDTEAHLSYFNFKTNPTVIGIGPGMGTHEKTIEGFELFLKENKLPLVIDADAINILAMQKNLLNFIPKHSVLTPHPKELERLLGGWKNDYEKLEKAKDFSKKYQITLVLKDSFTFIINTDSIFVNSTGNAALATAGSGDVLTGIITGLIAQNYNPLQAAIMGVYLHGITANLYVQNHAIETFTASKIIEGISEAYLSLFVVKEEVTSSNEQKSDSDMDSDESN